MGAIVYEVAQYSRRNGWGLLFMKLPNIAGGMDGDYLLRWAECSPTRGQRFV